MSSRRRDRAKVAPALLTLVVLFGGGLVGAVRQSLEPPLGGGISTWSLATWRSLLGDPAFLDALWFSARVTVAATVLSAALALLLAAVLRGAPALVRTLLLLPVPVPHLLVAASAVVWMGPGGLADRVLGGLPVDLVRDPHGLGIVAVYVYKETPFLLLLVLAVMGRALEQRDDAAAVLGASPAQRLRWVLWPAVRRPLCLGGLVVAAFVFGAFEVPLAVGPNDPSTLAVYGYESTLGDALTGSGRAAAALLVAAAGSVLAALVIVRAGRTWATRG